MNFASPTIFLSPGCYPARLKKVLIVTAPLWFKAPFKVLRLFVREKLRDRVFTVSIPQVRPMGGIVRVGEKIIINMKHFQSSKKNKNVQNNKVYSEPGGIGQVAENFFVLCEFVPDRLEAMQYVAVCYQSRDLERFLSLDTKPSNTSIRQSAVALEHSFFVL